MLKDACNLRKYYNSDLDGSFWCFLITIFSNVTDIPVKSPSSWEYTGVAEKTGASGTVKLN